MFIGLDRYRPRFPADARLLPPRALNEEWFLSGQRCSRQGRAEEASVPAKQSSDGGADLLFMLARHSQARRPVNDAVRLFSSTLTGWG